MRLLNLLFRSKKKKEASDIETESLLKVLTNTVVDKPSEKKEPLKTCAINDEVYHIGDKVISRSNEPSPLIVGHIVEFWDNDGKWETCSVMIKNQDNGEIVINGGVLKKYDEDLMSTLKDMRPFEQWNHMVPIEARYTEDQILKKENNYKKRKNIL